MGFGSGPKLSESNEELLHYVILRHLCLCLWFSESVTCLVIARETELETAFQLPLVTT